MKRTFWLSIAAYFVITMSVAYPWHMLIFHEKYLAMGAFTRAQPIMPFGMLSIVLQGAVLPTSFPCTIATKAAGVRFGAGSSSVSFWDSRSIP